MNQSRKCFFCSKTFFSLFFSPWVINVNFRNKRFNNCLFSFPPDMNNSVEQSINVRLIWLQTNWSSNKREHARFFQPNHSVYIIMKRTFRRLFKFVLEFRVHFFVLTLLLHFNLSHSQCFDLGTNCEQLRHLCTAPAYTQFLEDHWFVPICF